MVTDTMSHTTVFRAAAGGDAKAYEHLIETSRSVVCSIALALVRDVAASEEIAQDVYLAAWRGLGTLRNPDSFLPWLRQLTRNQATEHLRRFGRRDKKHVLDDALAGVVDPKAQPLQSLIEREDQAHLSEAIDQLPDDAREVVILYYREGQSVAQVAELLGLSEAAIKKRLSRARETLRESVLQRAGDAMGRTAPAAAFTAATIALVVAAPSTAAAATVGAAKSVASTKWLALLGGVALPFAIGAGTLLFGYSLERRHALDDCERRQLGQLFLTQLAGIVFFLGGIAVNGIVSSPLLLVGGTWLVTMVVFISCFQVWLPRIRARRYAAEVLADPTAAKRQRLGRIWSFIGLLLGVTTGTWAVIVSLLKLGAL